MALNYLKSHQLQDQLQNSIQALAIAKPDDLYHALGQDLANFTKAPEIVDQKVVPENEDTVTVCRSPLNFIGVGGFQKCTPKFYYFSVILLVDYDTKFSYFHIFFTNQSGSPQ